MKLNQDLRLMSIDPGENSGFAAHMVGDPIKGMLSWHGFYSHDQFFNQLAMMNPDVIICESFDHRAKDNINYTPIEYIGLVILYVERRYVERRPVELVFQTPSFGKSFGIDRLKKLGLYIAGADNTDQMMALRHMLQFLISQEAFDFGLLK